MPFEMTHVVKLDEETARWLGDILQDVVVMVADAMKQRGEVPAGDGVGRRLDEVGLRLDRLEEIVRTKVMTIAEMRAQIYPEVEVTTECGGEAQRDSETLVVLQKGGITGNGAAAVDMPQEVAVTPAVSALFSRAKKMTLERAVLTAKLRAGNMAWSAVLQEINRLPGEPISSVSALNTAYSKFNENATIKKFLAKVAARQVEYSAAAEQLARDAAAQVGARVTWDTAVDWALYNKVDIADLPDDEALHAINRVRRLAQLPEFIIEAARGPAERLPPPNVGGGGRDSRRKLRAGAA